MKKILLGFFMLCLGFNLSAQASNDDCANAIGVAEDEVVTFSTLNATTDGVKHPDCLGVPNDSIEADIWYTWTATSTGVFRWSNCGTADFDSRVAVYENAAGCAPTDAELVACNDDGPVACTGTIFTSEVNFFATMDNDYTFRMGGFAGTVDSLPAMGTGTVLLTSVNGPANDFCSTAIAIDLGEAQSFSTVNGLTDGPDHPNNNCFQFGFATMEADIWYTYTADFTGAVQWNTCDMVDFDTRLAIYQPGSACPPLDSDLQECNDDSGCNGLFHSTLIFDVVQGETYLLRLGGHVGGSGGGTFDLVAITPPVPPANDQCADADDVFVISPELADNVTSDHGLFFGSTVAGSQESDFIFPPCLGNTNGGEFSDVWYKFNTLSNDTLEIRFNPVTPGSTFLVDFYSECGVQIDSTLSGRCFETNEFNDPIRDTLFSLPTTDTDIYMRVTTRLTTISPGAFLFQIVGKNFIESATKDLREINAFELNPNPVNHITSVEFNLTENKRLSLSVVNNLGAVIQQEPVKQYLAGRHVQQIDMSNIPAGVYFIALNDGVNTKVQKVVKL